MSSCAVLPVSRLIREGEPAEFLLLASDRDGKGIHYEGLVSWAVTNANVVGNSFRAQETAAGAGEVEVSAVVDSITCTCATSPSFAKVENGSRVVVADCFSGQPVKNAVVVVGEEQVNTDANGVAMFTTTGTRTVSVFSAAHSYVTVANTESDDLIVYVQPTVEKVGFQGSKGPRDFERLEILNESLRIALMGSSIPGNFSTSA